MKILSIECSASPASCAVIEDGKIIASSFINTSLTHSQTLVSMIVNMLENSHITLNEIDKIAVAAGPGSFTGLRIGISAVKGLAAPRNIPCVAVSTLAAMSQSFSDRECIVCAVMDARCNQFYNAIFSVTNGTVTRLCADRALSADDLLCEVQAFSKENNVIICGDGADLFYTMLSNLGGVTLAPAHLKYQNAVGVGIWAYNNADSSNTTTPDKLLPVYLRLPQAERELKAKTNEMRGQN